MEYIFEIMALMPLLLGFLGLGSGHVARDNPYDPEYDPYDTESDRDDAAAEARAALKFGGAASPMFKGSEKAWEFAGGELGDPYGFHEGRKAMRDRYRTGATTAGQRQAPAVTATQIAQQQQEQFRNSQMQLLAQLQQRAAGFGPQSQAEQMALQQGGANARQAEALAVSARGAGGASALRSAREAQAQTGIAAQQQSDLVRIAEQQQAQQALGMLSGQVRGQDIGLATSQAGMDQQAALANQAASLQQTAQNDQMVQFYQNMGMSLQQAQIQAQIARQQMLSDIVRAQYNAAAGIITSGMESSAREQAAMLGALGTLGYGAGVAYGSSGGGNNQGGTQ